MKNSSFIVVIAAVMLISTGCTQKGKKETISASQKSTQTKRHPRIETSLKTVPAECKSLIDAGKAKEAIPLLNSIVSKRETNLASLEKKGASDEELEKARQLLANAYYQRASMLEKLYQFEDCIKDWDNAIKYSNPNDESLSCAYNNRGAAHWHICHWEEALSDVDSACNLGPLHADHFTHRALVKWLHGKDGTARDDNERALALCNKQIKDTPKNLLTGREFAVRADAYVGIGEFDKAIADAKKALTYNDKDDVAISVLGDAYFGKDEYEEALKQYSKAIKLCPKESLYLTKRGDLYNEIDDGPKAEADTVAAAKLGYYDPEHIEEE